MPRCHSGRDDRVAEARRRYDFALDELEASRSELELAEALTAISRALSELLRAVRRSR